jgi:DNA-binding NarL/FixJ family response regulator
MKRTILSIDDHELVRLGLRLALDRHFDDRFELAEASNLEGALRQLKAGEADVAAVLLDLHLSDTRGLGGLQLLREHHPGLPVIVLSGTRDERVQAEALSLGASDYICKTGDGGELDKLMRAIERASARAVPGHSGHHPVAGRPATGCLDRLGKRQVQVLELILAGHDNQAIVWETGLAAGSVKNCVSSIFLVFNVRSRAELIGLFAS